MSETTTHDWEAAAAVSESHKRLLLYVGRWSCRAECRMEPNGSPIVSTGTSEYKLILGGRYVQGNHKGDPFEHSETGVDSMEVIGYDNGRQHYTSYWIDEVTTQPILYTGTWKDGALHMQGKQDNGLTGVKDEPLTTVTTFSENKFVVEMFQVHSDGTTFVCMRLEFTKAQ